MAIGYCNINLHSRKAGHSAAAALAYRWGIKLTDCRTGETHDYRKRETREDIADTGIETSRPTALTESPQAFADALETAERRCDSRLCRDVVVALPAELNEAARIALAKEFATELAARYETVTAWAVHRPGEGDKRNHHAHILMPTRQLDADGNLGAKLENLDNPIRSGDEVAGIRNLWADLANRAIEAAGLDYRISIGRRLDQDATPTIPRPAIGKERKAAKVALHEIYRVAMDGYLGTDYYDEDRVNRCVDEELAGTSARNLITQMEFKPVTATGAAASAHMTAAVVTAIRKGIGTTSEPVYEAKARSRMSRWLEKKEQEKGGERPRRGTETEHHAAAHTNIPDRGTDPERPARKRRRRVRTGPQLAQEAEELSFGSLTFVGTEPDAPAALETTPPPAPTPTNPAPSRKRRRRVRAAPVTAPEPSPTPTKPAPSRKRRNFGLAVRTNPARLLVDLTPTVVAELGDVQIHHSAGAPRPSTPNLARLPMRHHQGAPMAALAAVEPHTREFRVAWGSPAATVASHSAQWHDHAKDKQPSIVADIMRDLLELFGAGQAKPTLAPPRTVPTPLGPSPQPNLDALSRKRVIAELENMKSTIPPPPSRAHVQAHADTHGQPPARAQLQDAETAAANKIASAVAVHGEHLRLAGTERAVAKGEAMIIRHAGHQPPPEDQSDPLRRYWTKPMSDELERHVAPFFSPDWRGAIARWRAHWREHGQGIARQILATVWSKSHQDDYTAEQQAKAERKAAVEADLARQHQPPTVVPAPDRSTWPGRGGGLDA